MSSPGHTWHLQIDWQLERAVREITRRAGHPVSSSGSDSSEQSNTEPYDELNAQEPPEPIANTSNEPAPPDEPAPSPPAPISAELERQARELPPFVGGQCELCGGQCELWRALEGSVNSGEQVVIGSSPERGSEPHGTDTEPTNLLCPACNREQSPPLEIGKLCELCEQGCAEPLPQLSSELMDILNKTGSDMSEGSDVDETNLMCPGCNREQSTPLEMGRFCELCEQDWAVAREQEAHFDEQGPERKKIKRHEAEAGA